MSRNIHLKLVDINATHPLQAQLLRLSGVPMLAFDCLSSDERKGTDLLPLTKFHKGTRLLCADPEVEFLSKIGNGFIPCQSYQHRLDWRETSLQPVKHSLTSVYLV